MEAPTIDGASELENKYGLDFCLNTSIISFFPEVKPPIAPPKALPRVDVIISTLPTTPQCSCVPRPVFPKNLLSDNHQPLQVHCIFLLNHKFGLA